MIANMNTATGNKTIINHMRLCNIGNASGVSLFKHTKKERLAMIHTDEDDEFARIEHEIEMRKGQPYHFADKWKTLTDMEILMAYGWKDFEASTLLQQSYKKMILEGLRSVEAAIKEKNA